jgi:hypothetical protein
MADKRLTETAWKAFSKKHDYKDAALLKALARLDSAGNDPGKQLEALELIEKEAAALRKANKADKDLAGQLDDMEKAADKARSDAQGAVKQAEKEAAESEDEEGPAALTTKLVPLLRAVPKGEVLNAMLAVQGKSVAVLLSRKTLSASAKKVLAAGLPEASGAKYYPAQCLFEANAHTFVMEKRLPSIAKLIKAALLEQTGLKVKVRVRGADPADVEDDGEQAEGGDPPQAEAAAPADPARAGYEKALAAIAPRLAQALKANVGDVTKIRALSQFAQGKAEASAFKAALQALQALEPLLGGAPAAAPAAGGDAATGGDPMEAFKSRLAALVPQLKAAIGSGREGGDAQRAKVAEAGALANKKQFDAANEIVAGIEAWLAGGGSAGGGASLVQLQKSRLAWDGLRKQLGAQLGTLERSILDAVRAHNAEQESEEIFDEGEVASGTQRLHALLDSLDERLIDKLDEALNAAGAERTRLQQQAAAIVREYQAFVDSDALIASIDGSGFAPTTIRADAQRTLAELAAAL